MNPRPNIPLRRSHSLPPERTIDGHEHDNLICEDDTGATGRASRYASSNSMCPGMRLGTGRFPTHTAAAHRPEAYPQPVR
jgi:hypothetical protein